MALVFTLATITLTQNTITQLTATRTPCNRVWIQAHPSNTSTVVVGTAAVTVNGPGFVIGVPAATGVVPFFEIPSPGTSPNGIDLSNYYLFSAGVSQKVNVFYNEG